MTKKKDEVILVLSDLHAPFTHPDALEFLAAVKAKYKPTKVISVGDEQDMAASSFHTSNPDLPSAGYELDLTRKWFAKLFKLFPQCDVVESNHGSIMYRKAFAGGLSSEVIKSYNDILGAPKGWKWYDKLYFKMSNGQYLYVTHGMKANGKNLAESLGTCLVQGHFHAVYQIQYSSSPSQLIWSMQVGCLIDDKSRAFAYNKTTTARPIIGIGIIRNGIPHLVPMVLNKKGRWNKKVH